MPPTSTSDNISQIFTNMYDLITPVVVPTTSGNRTSSPMSPPIGGRLLLPIHKYFPPPPNYKTSTSDVCNHQSKHHRHRDNSKWSGEPPTLQGSSDADYPAINESTTRHTAVMERRPDSDLLLHTAGGCTQATRRTSSSSSESNRGSESQSGRGMTPGCSSSSSSSLTSLPQSSSGSRESPQLLLESTSSSAVEGDSTAEGDGSSSSTNQASANEIQKLTLATPTSLLSSAPEWQTQFYKTKLCPYFVQDVSPGSESNHGRHVGNNQGTCINGAQCRFAHSLEELRPLPDLKKTKLCPCFAKKAECSNPKCPFAHSPEELRTSSSIFYKVTLCNFYKTGKCWNGSNCRFAHGAGELRSHNYLQALSQNLSHTTATRGSPNINNSGSDSNNKCLSNSNNNKATDGGSVNTSTVNSEGYIRQSVNSSYCHATTPDSSVVSAQPRYHAGDSPYSASVSPVHHQPETQSGFHDHLWHGLYPQQQVASQFYKTQNKKGTTSTNRDSISEAVVRRWLSAGVEVVPNKQQSNRPKQWQGVEGQQQNSLCLPPPPPPPTEVGGSSVSSGVPPPPPPPPLSVGGPCDMLTLRETQLNGTGSPRVLPHGSSISDKLIDDLCVLLGSSTSSISTTLPSGRGGCTLGRENEVSSIMMSPITSSPMLFTPNPNHLLYPSTLRVESGSNYFGMVSSSNNGSTTTMDELHMCTYAGPPGRQHPSAAAPVMVPNRPRPPLHHHHDDEDSSLLYEQFRSEDIMCSISDSHTDNHHPLIQPLPPSDEDEDLLLGGPGGGPPPLLQDKNTISHNVMSSQSTTEDSSSVAGGWIPPPPPPVDTLNYNSEDSSTSCATTGLFFLEKLARENYVQTNSVEDDELQALLSEIFKFANVTSNDNKLTSDTTTTTTFGPARTAGTGRAAGSYTNNH